MHSKRPLSPASLPPSKRLHGALSSSPSDHNPRPTFDTLFYDEIILSIFSYLPWTDLCSIQSTNRNWARLSLDNQVHTHSSPACMSQNSCSNAPDSCGKRCI